MDKETRHQLYFGRVVHTRLSPFRHGFSYRVFSALLDLDHLDDLSGSAWGFSYNHFNLFSFHDKDHGPRDGQPLKPWVKEVLAGAGVQSRLGNVRLLCYPRILGYVFNPLSVYYCYDDTGALVALIYEVANTFGERHLYIGEIEHPKPGSLEKKNASHIQTARKAFHVSPFFDRSGDYRFRLSCPESTLKLSIQLRKEGAAHLHTCFRGTARPLSTKALGIAFVKYPLMTLKVIGAIHFEALRLWMKGAKIFRKPEPLRPTRTHILRQQTNGQGVAR